MDSVEGIPHRAALPEQQLFTTYGNLKHFIQHEIDRLVVGRVEFRSHHTLEVCFHSPEQLVAGLVSLAACLCLTFSPALKDSMTSKASVNSSMCTVLANLACDSAAVVPLQGIEKVDVANKTVTFVKPGGEEVSQRYDLLVGAEGPVSVIRKVLVKSEGKKMKSQLSYIGPMRFVSARGLPAEDSLATDAFKRLTSPPDGAQSPIEGGGLQANGAEPTISHLVSNDSPVSQQLSASVRQFLPRCFSFVCFLSAVCKLAHDEVEYKHISGPHLLFLLFLTERAHALRRLCHSHVYNSAD